MSAPEGQAPARLTQDETRQSLTQLNISSSLRAVFDTICGGNTFIFVAFALSLGIAREDMGQITAILSFACVLQMAGLLVFNRVRDKKRSVLLLGFTEPLLLIAAVLLVPLMPAEYRLWGLAVAIFVAASTLHLTRPVTEDWIATTIPAGVRGRFLGKRFQVVNLCTICTTLLAGLYVSHVATKAAPPSAEVVTAEPVAGAPVSAEPLAATLHADDEPEHRALPLALFLVFGALFGIGAVAALSRATMPAVAAASHVAASDLRDMWRHRDFRRYLMAVMIFNIPFYTAIPYYQVYHLEILHMEAFTISLFQTGYFLVKIAILPMAGRLTERLGGRKVMFFCGLGYALFFWIYVTAAPERIWLIGAAWLVAGIPDAMYAVAITAALYGAVPQGKSRPAFFAVGSLLTLVFYGVGAQLAVPILKIIKDMTLELGPLVLGQFQLLYLWSGLLMPITCFAAFLLPGRAGTPARPAAHHDTVPDTPKNEPTHA